jgi:glycosyltransferase involved in cell wall biosynthesis
LLEAVKNWLPDGFRRLAALVGGNRHRLKVLTLVDGIGIAGGGERIARQIATSLDPERFDVAFCATRWSLQPEAERPLAELRDAGVEFLGLERRSRLDVNPWRKLVGWARARRIDVLHSHKIGSNIWGALLMPVMPDPVFVAHEHTWSYEGNLPRKLVDRHLIARRADAFVAVSREDQERMVAVEGVPREKTRFIPNGIPDFPGPTPGRDVRAELGIGPEQRLVGVVAALRPQKALEVMVRALPTLRARVPGVVVAFVGGSAPGEEERLRALAAGLGVGDALRFLGVRTDVPDLVAAFDVAALSSDFEGSPLSVLEYMEAAKPVVSTRVGGVPDLVEDGVTGLLVPPRDPEALATALADVLLDPDRAARMGEAGRARRQAEFTLGATARRIGELYEELLAAR